MGTALIGGLGVSGLVSAQALAEVAAAETLEVAAVEAAAVETLEAALQAGGERKAAALLEEMRRAPALGDSWGRKELARALAELLQKNSKSVRKALASVPAGWQRQGFFVDSRDVREFLASALNAERGREPPRTQPTLLEGGGVQRAPVSPQKIRLQGGEAGGVGIVEGKVVLPPAQLQVEKDNLVELLESQAWLVGALQFLAWYKHPGLYVVFHRLQSGEWWEMGLDEDVLRNTTSINPFQIFFL